MVGRSVPEWVGKTPNTPVPDRVKLRVWEKCNGHCQVTGKKIYPGDARDIDHIIAIINDGPNRESNLQLILKDPHKIKTKNDLAIKTKTARIRKKHLGLDSPKAKIQSRGFSKNTRVQCVHCCKYSEHTTEENICPDCVDGPTEKANAHGI